MRQLALASLLALSFASLTSAHAATVVSLVGDEDGFGQGITNGSGVDWSTIHSPDIQGTDNWFYGNQSVTHTYSLPADIVSASLEVFTAGQGLGGLSNVYLNGTLIGQLTDGDDVGPAYNYAWKDTFNLTPYLGLLTGSDTVAIQTPSSGDGWAWDYSKITITTAVPEASSYGMALAGVGVLGMILRRRRQAA
ncbi:MAG TPA: PEP-CTERM sorting domain-containing protein [Aquabacterium sp.]|nr:PEP-CTERM sorting domain-containing protein [Aquabacterium sp.]